VLCDARYVKGICTHLVDIPTDVKWTMNVSIEIRSLLLILRFFYSFLSNLMFYLAV
jgi:hypothetical protein